MNFAGTCLHKHTWPRLLYSIRAPRRRDIVSASTGIADERLFEDLYRHFALASSWEVAPGALQHLLRIRASGVKLAVVSNFDTRLRPILRELGLAQLFHNITVSAEVGAPQEFCQWRVGK